MHRGLVIAALTGVAALSCNRTPLSTRDAGGFDTADSESLVGQVIVMKEGTGRGTVISSPGGITCGGTCAADFAGPASVTLYAVPDSNVTFLGWSGECQGTGTCTIKVSATHALTATFAAQEHRLAVSQAGAGRGRVTSFPLRIDCGESCADSFETGLTVVLTAAAEGDSIFDGWSGACKGSDVCTLVLDADQTVVAHFDRATQGLRVAKSGTGTGRVSSSPSGIDCGSACTGSFAPGSDITLRAWPDANSTFTGWSGLCQGTEDCTIHLSAAGSATASFELVQYGLSIDKTGSGSGTVKASPAGIASANSCAATYPAGTPVTLIATPDETSVFTGWAEACSGAGACTVLMDASQSVSANFEAIRRRLSLSKAGNGEVTSVPSGLKCGDVCTADFVMGAQILLQATPHAGSTFAGWSGACSGSSETCTLIMDAAHTVSASFR
jgi:hypothetical protein